MSQDLYQQAIMEHAKAAVGGNRLENPDASVTLDNPLCGDRVTIDVSIDAGRIGAIGHQVRGCALCQASASVIGAQAPGKNTEDLATLYQDVTAMLAEGAAPPWPDLAAFDPVRAHKSRYECVLLPFEALQEALGKALGTAPSNK